MENARILFIDDDERAREPAQIIFERFGHAVVRVADTLESALEAIDDIASGDLEADVIVLDGNLRPHSRDGEDARTVFQRIAESGVTSTVIGYTLGSMEEYGVPVHADSGKSPSQVARIIEQL